MRKIMEELEDCPVIAAVKDEKGLEECLNMDRKKDQRSGKNRSGTY